MAEKGLNAVLSDGGINDSELIRHCCACGPAALSTLSVSTRKRLFNRFVTMLEEQLHSPDSSLVPTGRHSAHS